MCCQARTVSHGVRTHAQLPAVDLKSTPLTTRADSHMPAMPLPCGCAPSPYACHAMCCVAQQPACSRTSPNKKTNSLRGRAARFTNFWLDVLVFAFCPLPWCPFCLGVLLVSGPYLANKLLSPDVRSVSSDCGTFWKAVGCPVPLWTAPPTYIRGLQGVIEVTQ